MSLLAVEDLHVRFGPVHAVRGVSLAVRAGESVGVVGESGSGKSAAMLAVLGLHPPDAAVTASRLRLAGTDILGLPDRSLRDLRGRVAAMIFQDPSTALNPLMRVGDQVAEVVRRHRGLSWRAARAEAASRLDEVGITDAHERMSHYPHEFSGGMRQRVMIAAALAGNPSLLIADEPTTALDVTVQAELVRLLGRLQAERGMGLVWITHDLALMAGVVDRVLILYAGQVVEQAPVDALYAHPRHPYTRALLDGLPSLDATRTRLVLAGHVPAAGTVTTGCAFAPRCPRRLPRCLADMPVLAPLGESLLACWSPEP